jgi:hypothetical protein
MISEQTIDNNVEQCIASYVDYLNNIRLTDLMNTLESILTSETDKLSDLVTKSANALSNLEWAKTEIDNLININRGGETGVHGFISEFAETGIRNARDVYQGLQKSVVLLNDNGPADILLQGKEVQMKFYDNILGEIKQASNYDNMSMMFPKDHVEVIEKIMGGAKSVEFNGNVLSNSKINNIRKAIEDESALRGVSYDKWLESSVLKYKDVQKGSIKGGISGYAIYGLTNVCHLAAPSAGAITSETFGLSNAIVKYRKGDVDTDGFIDLVTLNSIDTTGGCYWCCNRTNSYTNSSCWCFGWFNRCNHSIKSWKRYSKQTRNRSYQSLSRKN